MPTTRTLALLAGAAAIAVVCTAAVGGRPEEQPAASAGEPPSGAAPAVSSALPAQAPTTSAPIDPDHVAEAVVAAAIRGSCEPGPQSSPPVTYSTLRCVDLRGTVVEIDYDPSTSPLGIPVPDVDPGDCSIAGTTGTQTVATAVGDVDLFCSESTYIRLDTTQSDHTDERGTSIDFTWRHAGQDNLVARMSVKDPDGDGQAVQRQDAYDHWQSNVGLLLPVAATPPGVTPAPPSPR